jgi:hypothetical protein
LGGQFFHLFFALGFDSTALLIQISLSGVVDRLSHGKRGKTYAYE